MNSSTLSTANVVPLFHKTAELSHDDEHQAFPERLLHNQDYTLILGRSSYMSKPVPKLPEAWDAARDTIQTLGQTCAKLDRDGVRLFIAADQAPTTSHPNGTTPDALRDVAVYDNLSCETLSQLLQYRDTPSRMDIIDVLETALTDYFERKAAGQTQPNGELFLVMLDGEPSDRQRLIDLIVQSTRRIDSPQELAIGLIQIGEDCMAQGFFQALDDDLHIAGAAHDIVHTQNVTTIDTDHPLDFLWDVLTD